MKNKKCFFIFTLCVCVFYCVVTGIKHYNIYIVLSFFMGHFFILRRLEVTEKKCLSILVRV